MTKKVSHKSLNSNFFPSFHISSVMLCCDVLTKEDSKDQKCFNIARGGLGLMAGLDNGTKRKAKGTVCWILRL